MAREIILRDSKNFFGEFMASALSPKTEKAKMPIRDENIVIRTIVEFHILVYLLTA